MRGELAFEHRVNAWVLILVLDLRATQLDAHIRATTLKCGSLAVVESGEAQGEIARRCGPGVEVLVEPVLGRHDDCSRSPVTLLPGWVAFAPQK